MGTVVVYKRRCFGFMLAFIAFVIDHTTKAMIMNELAKHQQARIILTPFLNVITAWNYGISFSLFSNSGEITRWALVALTTTLCFIVGWLVYTSKTRLQSLGYGCILGGAVGNLVDRINFGAVFDFIDFHIYDWHFYTFNGADKFITLGVIVILGDYIYTTHKQSQHEGTHKL